MITLPQILVGTVGKRVWVRVEGRGSFQNSPGLKDFARGMIERGNRDFAVDLLNCPVMDSTFMGTLAGIALRLREAGDGHFKVVRANERNTELLRSLGLDQLFQIEPFTPGPAPESLHEPGHESAGTAATAQTMLEAHEALVEADPQNLTKFQDVLEYLKEDLRDSH